MEEEVQSGPARGRGRSGRGTRRRGRGRCANRVRGLDGLEDVAVGGERGGAADRRGRGRGRVSNVDRQRLVDAFEDDNDYHELAALPYQMARSIIRVWLAEGRVQGGEGHRRRSCNIKLIDVAFYHHRRGLVRDWRFASQTRKFRFSVRHLQNQLITTKIAGKDSAVSYERNRPDTIKPRFQYATWLVNLGQYSHLPVCATSSIPSFTGVHQRQVYIAESGFNIVTRRSKAVHH